MHQTYNNDRQAPDSASTATALFGGVKTNYNTLGVDGNVEVDACDDSLNTDHHVDSIISWAQLAGKSTGRALLRLRSVDNFREFYFRARHFSISNYFLILIFRPKSYILLIYFKNRKIVRRKREFPGIF